MHPLIILKSLFFPGSIINSLSKILLKELIYFSVSNIWFFIVHVKTAKVVIEISMLASLLYEIV